MQSPWVHAYARCQPLDGTAPRRKQLVDQLSNFIAHRRIDTREQRLEILLYVPRHNGVGGG